MYHPGLEALRVNSVSVLLGIKSGFKVWGCVAYLQPCAGCLLEINHTDTQTAVIGSPVDIVFWLVTLNIIYSFLLGTIFFTASNICVLLEESPKSLSLCSKMTS